MSTKAVWNSRLDDASFIDATFPHSSLSIGEIPDSSKLSQTNIVWLRPKDIATPDEPGEDWSLFNDPGPADVMQSENLGNCWMMAELSALVQRRDIFHHIRIAKHFQPEGRYQIRLCIGGCWKVIVVDDFFPCDASIRQMIFAYARKNQLWVPLIEKALAKALGSYFSLYGAPLKGSPSQYDLRCFFTGAPCLTIDLYLPGSHYQAMQLSSEELKEKILQARRSNFSMTAWTIPNNSVISENGFNEAGLCASHAYSILSIWQIHRRWLIQLRNPWVKPSGNGRWTREWRGWTQDVRDRLQPSSSGIFWIPYTEFVNFFCVIRIAQV